MEPPNKTRTPGEVIHPAHARNHRTTDQSYKVGRLVRQIQILHTYYIKFRRNGKAESQTKRYQATNPGHAFQKCHREFPDAQLIQGWRQSERNGEHAVTYYEAPSTAAVVPGPRVKWEQMLFSFANQISLKPEKKRAGAGTHGLRN